MRLTVRAGKDAPTYAVYAAVAERLEGVEISVPLTLSFEARVSLGFSQKGEAGALCLDFMKGPLAHRLRHGGATETVVKAVRGRHDLRKDGPLYVFDATAGLGRESMLLSLAGFSVTSFERHPVVWSLLRDALNRAAAEGETRLPELRPCGTFLEQGGERPQVIYYDPMFPEREKSAQVKKDMQYFHALIGPDEDVAEYLEAALNLARTKVVVKRPVSAPPFTPAGTGPSYSLSGGACRFDCYVL